MSVRQILRHVKRFCVCADNFTGLVTQIWVIKQVMLCLVPSLPDTLTHCCDGDDDGGDDGGDDGDDGDDDGGDSSDIQLLCSDNI